MNRLVAENRKLRLIEVNEVNEVILFTPYFTFLGAGKPLERAGTDLPPTAQPANRC
jgi:hypothetical protein